ncbi:7508_t:CDS:2, partial [Racocetra fulgida]
AGESGKSTILKQMKLIHDGGYSPEERESFKEIIFSNTVQSMRVILEAMELMNIQFRSEEAKKQSMIILNMPNQIEGDHLPPNVSSAIKILWADGGVQEYVLRSRVKTTGITETTFFIGELTYRMFDVGGQRSERKKWIHCFENVTAIVFLVAISEYDQLLLEDETV